MPWLDNLQQKLKIILNIIEMSVIYKLYCYTIIQSICVKYYMIPYIESKYNV